MTSSRSQSGMAMILVLIFVAVAMAVLATINLELKDSLWSKSNQEFKRDYRQFLGNLERAIEQPDACTDVLRGVTLSSLNSFTKTSGRSMKNPGLGGGARLQPNWLSPDQKFSIYSLGVHLGPFKGWVSANRPNVYYRSYRAKLFVSARPCHIAANGSCTRPGAIVTNELSPGNFDGASKYKQIELVVYVDGNRRIQTCYGRDSVGQICETSGGVWNYAEKDPRFKCYPYRDCLLESRNGSSLVTLVGRNPSCLNPRYAPEIVGLFNSSIKYVCRWCNVNEYRPPQ